MHLPSFRASTALKPPVLPLQSRSPPGGSGPQPSGRVAMATTGFPFSPAFPLPTRLPPERKAPRPASFPARTQGLGQLRLICIPLSALSPPRRDSKLQPIQQLQFPAVCAAQPPPPPPRGPRPEPYNLPGASQAALSTAAGPPSHALLYRTLVAAYSCTFAAGRGRPAPGDTQGRPALRILATTLWRCSTPLCTV